MADEPEDSCDDAAANSSPTVLKLSYVYETLAHARRRYLCYEFLDRREWTLWELASRVAALERDVPEHAITTDQREQVYRSLYHVHVPKLIDEKVVAYDDLTDTVTLAERAETVLMALEAVRDALDACDHVSECDGTDG